MKKFILIFCLFGTLGCQILSPTLPSPEKVKTETINVVEMLKTDPQWLKMEASCPTDIFPSDEIEYVYNEDNCKNSPVKCLENCKNESGGDCYSLAILIQRQVDIKQIQADSLFFRSCKLGLISACTNFAAAKLDREPSNKESVKCAINTFEKTCEKDDPWGCTMFGMVLANGLDRPKDLDKALNVLTKSCKYGIEDEACSKAKKLKKSILDSRKNNNR